MESAFYIKDVNNKYTNLFGMPHIEDYEELQEYWENNIIHPDDREEQLQYHRQNKFPKNRTYRVIHPQKGVRYINTHISDPITYRNKACKITIARDVTETINKPQ